MKQEIYNHLTGNLIPFWENLADEKFGGFYGLVTADGRIDKEAEKGTILHARILWFFSNASMTIGKKIPAAKHAYEWIKNIALDKENGGVYWSTTFNGKPLDTTKHTYCQAFAIYGLSSYYLLSKDKEALDLAVSLYNIIEDKCTGELSYREAFNKDFTPTSNEKLSENGVEAYYTMNTLLHVMEGYTELYRALLAAGENILADEVAEKLNNCLKIEYEKIYSPELKRQLVFFDDKFNSIIDLYSYGHDIETSWLLDRTVEVLGDKCENKDALLAMTKQFAEEVYTIAFDGHSLPYEAENGFVNTTRAWWVQAEAALGFNHAYQKTGDEKFREATEKVWQYIKNNFILAEMFGDEPAEWANELNMDGTSKEMDLVSIWKCPYHNGRMCIELINNI